MLFQVAEEVVGDVSEVDTLTMKVGQLFHLEGAFFGNELAETLATEKDVLCVLNLGRNFLGFVVNIIKCHFHVGRKHFKLTHKFATKLF